MNAPYFNPRSPHGERRRCPMIQATVVAISIHAPRTGSDCLSTEILHGDKTISIHAPRTGSDPNYIAKFLTIHISIHAPRTGSDQLYNSTFRGYCISIHAPRTGSDNQRRAARGRKHISIHAPRTGSDRRGKRKWTHSPKFQSTLPARGATPTATLWRALRKHFNPRSPHGERP